MQRPLHDVRGDVVAGPDLDVDARRDGRLGVVEDRVLRHHAVGHDDELALLGQQLGGPPGDFLHPALEVADAHPVADAERLLDLNRQPGEEVAEGVLQREADDDGAHRRGGEHLLVEQQRRRHREQGDDDDVLHDRRHTFRDAVRTPRVEQQADGGDEPAGNQQQASQTADQGGVTEVRARATSKPKRHHQHDHGEAEPRPHEAVTDRGQRRRRRRPARCR